MAHKLNDEISKYGADILASPGMQREKEYFQHGGLSCYAHSLRVAGMSVRLAARLHLRLDRRSLVRGALLHDYFLYDWHAPEKWHRLHGFRHARRALRNASRDFALNEVERDIIETHMFPLNLRLPRYRESLVVCVADKLCALGETFCARLPGRRPPV